MSDLDAPTTKKGTSASARQTAIKKGKSRATSSRTTSARKVKVEPNPDVVPDSEEEDHFTASEEEEAYAEFEGDDDELDLVPRASQTKKTPARAPPKKKVVSKKTNTAKGKAVAVQEITEDDVEEEMMKAAIAVSFNYDQKETRGNAELSQVLFSGIQESLKTMEQPRAGPSRPKTTARNKESEKRARAAEREFFRGGYLARKVFWLGADPPSCHVMWDRRSDGPQSGVGFGWVVQV